MEIYPFGLGQSLADYLVMRLIAWNANYNARRRTLEETAALLAQFHADILVISETAPPCGGNPLGAHWMGCTPGLAVIARAGLELVPHPANVGAPPLMAGYSVRGDLDFSLLALWPVQIDGGLNYHRVLMAALDRYAGLLTSGRAIMAGDLNSNTRVSGQETTHPKFVAVAESLGLVSAYHALTGDAHGMETVGTYRHGARDSKEFHLDYCFLSNSLVASANLSVRRHGDWPQLSDHFPVMLDIPDAELSQ